MRARDVTNDLANGGVNGAASGLAAGAIARVRRLVTVLLVMRMSAACPLRAAEAPPPQVERLEIAFAALNVRDLDDRVWTAEALRGRVVLLDFWATWCAPCLAELPALKRLRATHADRPFTLLGINLDPLERRAIAGWLRRQDVRWPQVHDRRGYEGDLARAFEVQSLPRTVLLDARGRVIAVNLRGDALARAVADALDEPGPGAAAR